MGFELDFKKFIEASSEIVLDEVNTESYDKSDFALKYNNIPFVIDCKEKKSKSRHIWGEISGVPLDVLFVFDETAIKKLFLHYPYAFALIREIPDCCVQIVC